MGTVSVPSIIHNKRTIFVYRRMLNAFEDPPSHRVRLYPGNHTRWRLSSI